MTGLARGADAASESEALTWTGCLDAFQDHLEQQWEALAAGRLEDIGAFRFPEVMPPVPPRLVAPATALLERAEELERALTLAQEEVRRQLRLARRMNATSPTPASFIAERA